MTNAEGVWLSVWAAVRGVAMSATDGVTVPVRDLIWDAEPTEHETAAEILNNVNTLLVMEDLNSGFKKRSPWDDVTIAAAPEVSYQVKYRTEQAILKCTSWRVRDIGFVCYYRTQPVSVRVKSKIESHVEEVASDV